ncbi:cytochrome c551 [Paenibacillus sp. UNCCL117]|uniref:c-type cytochrome n=1 Tax=unclassified Paenibacillus TaxID=185978 RepID=UPI00088DE519|nr:MULTISPECIES: cytochrome c [unclassified Paenibacillus]SDE63111.1 cytochrome c551 [Paenibacillus sp. cl123]SFW70195.1 cytochrome c551 [Paenibacillus sp. UNCCL117]
MRKRRTPVRGAVAVGLLASALLLLSACAAKDGPEPFGGGKAAGSTMTAEEAMAGASSEVQALYKQSCLSCHATNLEGRVGPKTNLQHVGGRMTKEEIAKQIENGGNGMPGFQGKLKPEEIGALSDWLAGLK